MTSELFMKPHLSLLTVCLLLSACSHSPPPPQSDILPPASWQTPTQGTTQTSLDPWWHQFASPQLERLVEQARLGSYDVAAAIARVRQAQAQAVIAGGPLLPELKGGFNANREQLLRNNGYSQLSASSTDKAVDYFNATLTASYEVDFWGGKAAARDSAEHHLRASRFDQANVELTLLGNVANSYMDVLALREQEAIAKLNLDNAEQVLRLVQTRYDSGSANAQELAQQKGLVAAQQRQLPLFRQQAQDALVTLATLLGQPVQNLKLDNQPFAQISWPQVASGLPSELLSRRPDIATAEARLAAAQADVKAARAAMLPTLTLTANLGSGADHFPEMLRNPFYNIGAGVMGPIFNNGRLGAERDKASAVQEELLQTYRNSIISAFGDVEKALNNIDGLDQQRRWQNDELEQALTAFKIAENRYRAGAQDLLSVLDTQRTLYQAQDQDVQLRLSRLKSSITLYKALGGGWQPR